MATSPLPSRGPQSGRYCHATLAFSGVSNKKGQNQKWLCQPCQLGGSKMGGIATQPLRSRGGPIEEDKIRSRLITPAVSDA